MPFAYDNLSQEQNAWQMYTDENDDIVPLAWLDNGGPPHYRALPGSWVLGNAVLDGRARRSPPSDGEDGVRVWLSCMLQISPSQLGCQGSSERKRET